MNFDATSLYPSALYDEKSVHPKRQSGFALQPHMNDVYMEAFNSLMMVMTAQFQILNFTILLILYFNIYRLKRKLKISKLTEWEMVISLTR